MAKKKPTEEQPKQTAPKAEKKVKVGGLGDLIAKATEAVGITPCDGCKKRKEWLNTLFPNKRANAMTAEEKEKFSQLMNLTRLKEDDLKFIEQLYFKSFNITNVKYLCRSCPAVWVNTIKQLKKLYENQIKMEFEEQDEDQ